MKKNKKNFIALPLYKSFYIIRVNTSLCSR